MQQEEAHAESGRTQEKPEAGSSLKTIPVSNRDNTHSCGQVKLGTWEE